MFNYLLSSLWWYLSALLDSCLTRRKECSNQISLIYLHLESEITWYHNLCKFWQIRLLNNAFVENFTREIFIQILHTRVALPLTHRWYIVRHGWRYFLEEGESGIVSMATWGTSIISCHRHLAECLYHSREPCLFSNYDALFHF